MALGSLSFLLFLEKKGGLFCYHFFFLSLFFWGDGGGGSASAETLSVFAHIKKGKSRDRYCIFSVYKYSFRYRGKTK